MFGMVLTNPSSQISLYLGNDSVFSVFFFSLPEWKNLYRIQRYVIVANGFPKRLLVIAVVSRIVFLLAFENSVVSSRSWCLLGSLPLKGIIGCVMPRGLLKKTRKHTHTKTPKTQNKNRNQRQQTNKTHTALKWVFCIVWFTGLEPMRRKCEINS